MVFRNAVSGHQASLMGFNSGVQRIFSPFTTCKTGINEGNGQKCNEQEKKVAISIYNEVK